MKHDYFYYFLIGFELSFNWLPNCLSNFLWLNIDFKRIMLNNGSHIRKDIYNQTKYGFIIFLFSLDLYYSLSLKFITDYKKKFRLPRFDSVEPGPFDWPNRLESKTWPGPFPPHSPDETLALTVPFAPVIVSRRRCCRMISANPSIGYRHHVWQSVRRPGLRHLTEGNLLPQTRSPPPSQSCP
jgi:hypothetical protein